MSVEKHVQLIKARYDAVNAHDLNRFQSFYADSITWSDPGLRSPITGPQAVRQRLEALVSAFPDLHWKLDHVFGQGEHVCAEFTFTGTHRGWLHHGDQRIPPTNKSVRVQACGVYLVRGGKIIDSKVYFDFGHLMEDKE